MDSGFFNHSFCILVFTYLKIKFLVFLGHVKGKPLFANFGG